MFVKNIYIYICSFCATELVWARDNISQTSRLGRLPFFSVLNYCFLFSSTVAVDVILMLFLGHCGF